MKRRMHRAKVGGILLVYEPGFSEYLCVIDPPFSHIKFSDVPGRIDILDDLSRFKGDENKRREGLEATMNMVIHLAQMSKMMSNNFASLAQIVEKRANVKPAEEAKVVEMPKIEPKDKKEPRNPEDVFREALIYALLQDPNANATTRETLTDKMEGYLKQLRERDDNGSIAAQLLLAAMPQNKTDFQIAWELSKSRNKPFFIDTLKVLMNQYDRDEISLSKVMEELNITAVKWADERDKKAEDQREFPCENCEEGEMKQVGSTQPNGQVNFECNKCGHTATFP